jgi:hypothetical protein
MTNLSDMSGEELLSKVSICSRFENYRDADLKSELLRRLALVKMLQRGFVNLHLLIRGTECDPAVGIGMATSAVSELLARAEKAEALASQQELQIKNQRADAESNFQRWSYSEDLRKAAEAARDTALLDAKTAHSLIESLRSERDGFEEAVKQEILDHSETQGKLTAALRERDQAQLRLKQAIAGLTWLGENEAMDAAGLAEQLIAAETRLASALSSLTRILELAQTLAGEKQDWPNRFGLIRLKAKTALASLTSETPPKPEPKPEAKS